MFKGRKIIALCLTRLSNDETTAKVAELNKALVAKDYRLFVYNACTDFYHNNRFENAEKKVYSLIDYNVVDAVVIFSEAFRDTSIVDELRMDAEAHNVPVFILGNRSEKCTSFIFDYEAGFEQAVRHIIEYHGITDTAMIAGFKGEEHSEQRIAVYKKVLAENGLPFNDNMLSYGDYWSDPAQKAVEDMIAKGHVPKAIICANDMMAITACAVLNRHGYKVPDDVAVVGFDGTEEAKQCTPPITTCRCSYSDTAKAIADALEKVFAGGKVLHDNYVDFVLDVYNSCGCDPERPPYNVGNTLKTVRERFCKYQDDNALLCELAQEIVTGDSADCIVEDLKEYNFYNICIMVNQSFWNEALNPLEEKWNGFDDEMCILYKSDDDSKKYPMNIMRKDVLIDIDYVMTLKNPVVFNVISSYGIPMGYMCVHFTADVNGYCMIPQYVYALNNALSGYRNAMHLKYTAKSIEKISENDYLTGIYNRNGFYKQLSWLQRKNAGRNFTVASIDLDGLKNINDHYGHDEGDFAISSVADAIRSIPIENKICGRFGGDEFVVCAVTAAADNVGDGAEGIIRRHVENFLACLNKDHVKPYPITASIGMCSTRIDFDFDAMLKQSDERMYAEKNLKPNRRRN